MKYNPEIHHRRSIRLPGHDYRLPGAYFITICVHDKSWLFGCINNEKMVPSEYGIIVDNYWRKISQHNDWIDTPIWSVMPNHFHSIAIITAKKETQVNTTSGSLVNIIGNFKSITTRKINEMRYSKNAKVWQRNYYEHIIRDENEYNRIVSYIENNPVTWEKDFYYDS